MQLWINKQLYIADVDCSTSKGFFTNPTNMDYPFIRHIVTPIVPHNHGVTMFAMPYDKSTTCPSKTIS